MADEQLPNEFEQGFNEYESGGPVEQVGSGNSSVEESFFLRDLSEDEAYQRLQRVNEFPEYINGLESRFSGNMSQYEQRVAQLEKALAGRTSLNADKLTQVLEAYDPKLAEVLVPALQEAFQVTPLDENTLRPYLEPVQQHTQNWVGEQLVMSVYPPETLAEIIPPVKDGRFAPEGQRHKDFIDWYSQQGYQTQQSLLSFGAPYINAIRKFEAWESAKKKERTETAGNKSSRLAQGQLPTAQSRRVKGQAGQTPEDVFLAAFEEASAEGR